MNAYEITTIKFSNNSSSAVSAESYLTPIPNATKNGTEGYESPTETGGANYYTSLKTTRYAQPYLLPTAVGDEAPNPTYKIYADPGNKKDVIFNWFKENKVSKINSNDIK